MKSDVIIAATAATAVLLCAQTATAQQLEHRLDSKVYVQCMKEAETRGGGDLDCNNDELDRQTQAINVLYKSVMGHITDPAKKTELRDAEREWIRHTKQKCTNYASDGGEIGSTEFVDCNRGETESRIIYLTRLNGGRLPD